MQFQLLSEGDEWWSEMPELEQRQTEKKREGRGGSQPWYHICAIFCTNPSESARSTQRGCVVTPWTRRTLPSRNSTSVMSCKRGCSHDADWTAHFHRLAAWLTFELHCGSHKHEQKEKERARPRHVHMWTSVRHAHMQRYKSHYMLKQHVNTGVPFASAREKNGFSQPRPKCRVHSPPEALLSLIRGASSCFQLRPAHRRDGSPAQQHWFPVVLFHFSQSIPPFSFRLVLTRCQNQHSLWV